MYKVCGLDDSYPKNITFEKEYEDWTESQDKAVQLLEDGVEPAPNNPLVELLHPTLYL